LLEAIGDKIKPTVPNGSALNIAAK
jgi:hypothetical protein